LAAHAADEGGAEICGQDLVSLVAEQEAFGNLNSSTKGRDIYKQLGHWTEYTQCKLKSGQDGTSPIYTYHVDLHPDNKTVFITRIANDTGVSELFGPFQSKTAK